MNRFLILGAGRSSSSLIRYVQLQAQKYGWRVTVGDQSLAVAQERLAGVGNGVAIRFDIHETQASAAAIAETDVVVSLLPAHLHILVARLCLQFGKHLLTASYINPEMDALNVAAREKALLFLNECGLDPGIDHMSAMQVLDRIRDSGGRIVSFESFTGGLIAPETAPDNPWRYKFTWNPRNVVVAGQSTAKYLLNGTYQYIPYHQLFRRITPVVVEGVGYEGYANRDSLKYREAYGLQDVQTMLRGTLRHEGFCSAWNVLVQLGCCDDSYEMEQVSKMTHRSFLQSFVTTGDLTLEEALCRFLSLERSGPEMSRLSWSGFFDNEPVGLDAGSPARVLEAILLKKWTLAADDKDLVVMWHRFVYELNGKRKKVIATLKSTGLNAVDTAMARTVGLPLGIAACLLMKGEIATRGVAMPVTRDIYEPVLRELRDAGIALHEREE